jgi:hypothetical protein
MPISPNHASQKMAMGSTWEAHGKHAWGVPTVTPGGPPTVTPRGPATNPRGLKWPQTVTPRGRPRTALGGRARAAAWLCHRLPPAGAVSCRSVMPGLSGVAEPNNILAGPRLAADFPSVIYASSSPLLVRHSWGELGCRQLAQLSEDGWAFSLPAGIKTTAAMSIVASGKMIQY